MLNFPRGDRSLHRFGLSKDSTHDKCLRRTVFCIDTKKNNVPCFKLAEKMGALAKIAIAELKAKKEQARKMKGKTAYIFP